jgi:valyl-tRNA synthetase
VAEVNMAARYEPGEVEKRLMERWLETGAFNASIDDSRPTYTVPIPPPNVTGSLHMGHALNDTIQDILVRYHHLKGFNTLWVLGTDHAGIATQNKVEARLATEGLKKEDLGRDAFIEKVWEWRREFGSTIIHQMKSLGCAADYENERFTMDEAYQKAVAKVFVSLHEKGDIYRDVYLVNWCVRCGSAISDLEVEHEDRASKLYHVKYPIAGASDFLTVATTRPETIMGDTAVAVNPKDPRYGKYVGGKAVVPFVGREVPIIADEHVDIEFGTGALKITPGHDPDDWEIGMRHKLPSVSVIGPDGIMTAEAAEFAGMTAGEAREAVLRRLEEEGLFVKADDYNHSVGTCYRCGTTIEPLLSLQWFMKMDRLAPPAIKAVEDGRIRFFPERWGEVYLDWMRGIRPWCISRQLWWGHRVPVYTCESCEHVTIAETAPDKCEKCGGPVHQEEDVLDTWFSSALWPFATLGWPEKTDRLAKFYPTSVLSTARDIIYLWVARMIMEGLEFMGDVPFRDVIIHPTVMAADGRRMSKSLGTGVDPLVLIDQYGADATRYGLIYMASTQDVRFSAERIEMGRNFANKIWNASRFVLHGAHPGAKAEVTLATVADKWIFSRLAAVTKEVAALYESYDFDVVARSLYRFVWNELCDWYLEVAKARLYSEDESERLQVSGNLLVLLERVMLLLHPLMPFLTEEIYGNLSAVESGDRAQSIFSAKYPDTPAAWEDPAAEAAMEAFMTVVGGLRSTREELGLARDVVGQARILEEQPGAAAAIFGQRQAFRQLSGCELTQGAAETTAPSGRFASVQATGVKAYLDLEGLVDVERERVRLVSKAQKADAEAAKCRAKLGNQGFVAKAPAEVVAEEQSRLTLAEAVLEEALVQYRERVGGELPLARGGRS